MCSAAGTRVLRRRCETSSPRPPRSVIRGQVMQPAVFDRRLLVTLPSSGFGVLWGPTGGPVTRFAPRSPDLGAGTRALAAAPGVRQDVAPAGPRIFQRIVAKSPPTRVLQDQS